VFNNWLVAAAVVALGAPLGAYFVHLVGRQRILVFVAVLCLVQFFWTCYAATGLVGAWLLTGFASFRLVTLYLKDEPSPEFLVELGFREQERGANVWLVVPNDEGVFYGGQTRDEVPCVHPVQIYLDLKFHPECSAEAAEYLKEKYLVPVSHA
jgi:hypothetical protein